MRSLSQLSSLVGKTAWITGGAGHIGSAIQSALIEWGAKTVVLDCSAESINQAVSNHPTQSLGRVIDLEDEENIRKVTKNLLNDGLAPNIFIHAAALVGTSKLKGWAVPFEEQSTVAWRRAMEVNLNSFFLMSQLLTPSLKKCGNGSIIAIGSIYGVCGPDISFYEGTGLGNPAAYAASKGGLIQLVRWLSTVLAPEIRVNCVSPGGIFRNQDSKFVERYEKKTPLRRMGTEEDIKGAVAYLSSDLSAYVTGQNLMVDGGWTAW